jgi:prevent-host-death family protein
MEQAQWTIQDAKNKFSAVVNAVQAEKTQMLNG